MPTRLGQNFLHDLAVLEKIIRASAMEEADFILEIGPGEGILTEKLLQSGKKIIAIELDDKLIPSLTEKFSPFRNIELIHGDILKIHLPELIEKTGKTNYKLIANIPYYITSPIIRLFLEQNDQPQEMILMIQKEVAQRIVAKKGQKSILAISVGYYAAAEILFTVGKESFSPAPKVDSAVIKIVPQRKFNPIADKKFFRIVKAGFSAKRKTLANNLSVSLQMKKEAIENMLLSISFNGNTRAQELDVADWEKLASLFDATDK